MRRSLFRLRRSPAGFWVVAVVLALLTGTTVSRLVGRAEAEAARYGSPRTVVVARRDVVAGARLTAADVERRVMPAAFVPPSAAGASAASVVGRVVVVPLARGQVVVAHQLAPDGLSAVAALVPSGARAVALPTGGLAPPLQRGDVVDVYATFDDGADPPTFAVARAVRVVSVSVDDDTVSVAVDGDDVDRVAFAVVTGEITIVLAGESP